MVKKLISLLLAVSLILGVIIIPNSNTVQAESKAAKAKKEYKKILRSAGSSAEFWCYDINHDGVLELLLNDGATRLYYYGKNKIKKSNFSYAFACYKKGGVFCSYSASSGYETERYYIISNGKVKVIASKTDDSGTGSASAEGPQYYIAGKKVSEDKFNSYIKAKTRNSKTIEPKWHTATKANINRYVK